MINIEENGDNMDNSDLSEGEDQANNDQAGVDESRLSMRHPRKIVVHEMPKKIYRTPGANSYFIEF